MWNRQLWDVDSQEVIKQVKPILNATGSGGRQAEWTQSLDIIDGQQGIKLAVMLTPSTMTPGSVSRSDAVIESVTPDEGFYFGA